MFAVPGHFYPSALNFSKKAFSSLMSLKMNTIETCFSISAVTNEAFMFAMISMFSLLIMICFILQFWARVFWFISVVVSSWVLDLFFYKCLPKFSVPS